MSIDIQHLQRTMSKSTAWKLLKKVLPLLLMKKSEVDKIPLSLEVLMPAQARLDGNVVMCNSEE